jgi:hypothetical protein
MNGGNICHALTTSLAEKIEKDKGVKKNIT